MGDGEASNVCKQPTSFYLMAVALRSFFLVLATHLLAGEVDTTLAGAPLTRRLSWWCRYYNPLNLSWRYYSMFAYRFMARSWGTHQLALINHEEHPFLPPLPYIIGETIHPLHVRRLEMAGLLSSQGILTFSAAYQGFLAIQYAISTEGIPYLPNVTVPLAMVGLFRVMASKWVASKIQVDAYPYPCFTAGAGTELSTFKSSNAMPSSSEALSASPPPLLSDTMSAFPPHKNSDKGAHGVPPNTQSSPICSPITKSRTWSSSSPMNVRPLSLFCPSCHYTAGHPSPPTLQSMPPDSHLVLQPPVCSSLPVSSRPYSILHASIQKLGSVHALCSMSCSSSLSPTSESAMILPMFPVSQASQSCTEMPLSASCLCPRPFCTNHYSSLASSMSSQQPLSPLAQHGHFQPHQYDSSSAHIQEYKCNKIVVAGWIGVLVGLVTLSFLPYKVAAAYQLPRKLLQFSMQVFYQYIAVSEFVFHAFLLYQGPRALANRVLFFDHWAFKAQTVGFFCLLMFMLVVSLMDFVHHGFYRICA